MKFETGDKVKTLDGRVGKVIRIENGRCVVLFVDNQEKSFAPLGLRKIT